MEFYGNTLEDKLTKEVGENVIEMVEMVEMALKTR